MVRKIVTRSTHRVVGYHSSAKSGDLISFESQIERDYLRWLEVAPDVKSFESQPCTFKWADFRYTPDVLVRTQHGSYYAEVKPTSARQDISLQKHLEEIRKRLAQDGLAFNVIYEDHIRREPLRSNVLAMSRLRRRRLYNREEIKLSEIQASLPCTFSQLSEKFGSAAHDLVLVGTVRRSFYFDITKKIDRGTVISKMEN